MRAILTALVALVASSCANLPITAEVNAFGESASATTNVVRASIAAHQTIAATIGQEREANNFLAGRAYTLGETTDTTLAPAQLQVRIGAVAALQQYATALATASDRQTVEALEKASEQLGVAVSSAAAVAFPQAAPIIGPAARVVSRVIGIGLGNAYAIEIRAIIQSRDKDVGTLSTKLAADMSIIADHLDIQQFKYSEYRRLVLDRIAADRRVDKLSLYAEYKQARADVASIETMAAAAKRAPAILTALAKTHHKLAVGAPDSEESLRQFLALADDLSSLVTAIAKQRGE